MTDRYLTDRYHPMHEAGGPPRQKQAVLKERYAVVPTTNLEHQRYFQELIEANVLVLMDPKENK